MSYLAIPPGHGCMHEAGHALVATLLRMEVPLVWVRRSGEPPLKLNGREMGSPCFTVAIPRGRPMSSGNDTRASMLVAVGGLVADMLDAAESHVERESLLATCAVRAGHDLAMLSSLSRRLGDTGDEAVQDSFRLALAVLSQARAPLAEISNRLLTNGRTDGGEIAEILRAYPDALQCIAGWSAFQALLAPDALPVACHGAGSRGGDVQASRMP